MVRALEALISLWTALTSTLHILEFQISKVVDVALFRHTKKKAVTWLFVLQIFSNQFSIWGKPVLPPSRSRSRILHLGPSHVYREKFSGVV